MEPRSAAFDKVTKGRFLTLEQVHDRDLTASMMRETIKNVTGIQFGVRFAPLTDPREGTVSGV
jgi:hypothetical protein